MWKFAAVLGGLCVFILLNSCGEMDTVYSSSETYRLDAIVSESSLNNCSIIGRNNTVRPYFLNSVAGDPDIRGLTVFLLDSRGNVISGKLQYSLYLFDSVLPGEGEMVSAGGGYSEGQERAEPGGLGSVLGDEIPGQEEAESGGEKRAEDSLIRLGAADRLELVTRLDMEFPPFALPEALETGRYTLVFLVQGEKGALYRIEKPFFYTGGAGFSIGDIQSFLPGYAGGSALVPPGTTVMLEVQINAGKGLDPYVVWYNGRKRIAEGRVEDGANRLMWKAPEQTGFQNIRAELFPFRPLAGMGGKVKELSLPVSAKEEVTGYFFEDGVSISRWYQLGADLQDAKAAGDLVPQGTAVPRWLSGGGIYGLALGAEDVYALRGHLFTITEQGTGRIMLRLKPLGEGLIFKASLAAEGGNGVELTLSYAAGAFRLQAGAGLESYAAADYEYSGGEDFTALLTEFRVSEGKFNVSLGGEDLLGAAEEISFTLPGKLSGEGTIQFGGALAKETPPARESAEAPPGEDSAPAASVAASFTAILDEAALAFKADPPAPAEEAPDRGGGGGRPR